METRTITQVRIYKLMLNPMPARAEAREIAAVSTDYDKLVEWYHAQKAAEPYREDGWYRVFKPDSPLAWYNQADSLELNDTNSLFGHGIYDEWVNEDVYHEVRRSGRFHHID